MDIKRNSNRLNTNLPHNDSGCTSENEMLRLNIGGKCYRLSRELALGQPGTRLAQIARLAELGHASEAWRDLCDDISPGPELFFDRDPGFFSIVLAFHRSGKLHLPSIGFACPRRLADELTYWGLHPSQAERCCSLLYDERQAELGDHHELNHNLSAVLPNADIQDPWLLRPHHWRHRLWLLLEQPTSSPIAHAVAIFAILPALLSLLAGAMETVTHEYEGDEYIWSNIEGACVLYFTAELVLRWFATPSLAVFVRLKHVILDLLLLLAYYVHLILHWWSNSVHGKTQGHGYKVLHQLHSSLRLLDLLRVCRVLRMVRHTISIWALMFTLRQCLQKLGILWLLLMTFGVFGFAPLMYIVEFDHPESNLTNIPVANWWAMTTITTVGYGDIIPKTRLGQGIALTCIVYGLVLNRIPVYFLFSNFHDHFVQLRVLEAQVQRAPLKPRKTRSHIRRALISCRLSSGL